MLRGFIPGAIAAGCLAFSAAPAFAVDGVVLIDQNRVLAGNVTPGDTPGFPVTLSTPGSYRLSGNLTLPSANSVGVLIASSDITLDLNGFAIIGPLVCTYEVGVPTTVLTCQTPGNGRGVYSNSITHNVTIQNGTIRGTGFAGVDILGSGVTVKDMKVESTNGYGINVQDGIVTRNIVAGNRGGGIRAGGVVTDNVANFNGFGIFVQGTTGTIVSRNSASFNVEQGLYCSVSTGFSENTFYYNNGNGTQVNPTCAGRNLGANLCKEAQCP